MIGLDSDRASRFVYVNGKSGAKVSLHLEYLFVVARGFVDDELIRVVLVELGNPTTLRLQRELLRLLQRVLLGAALID